VIIIGKEVFLDFSEDKLFCFLTLGGLLDPLEIALQGLDHGDC
jgi:hypothetical protein